MSSAAATFDAHVAHYASTRRRMVPGFDAFYAAAAAALALGREPRRVLDLGAGTGLMSARIAEAFPEARFELLDGSRAMLAEARRSRLADRIDAVHVADMADVGALGARGPFDAIVSALAIHHLADDEKRALLRWSRERLAPGGAFVNAEQVAGPTPGLDRAYGAWHRRRCAELGATDAELRSADERMAHDRCADVGTQLGWMREAGFAAADCVYKDWRFAVLCGFTEDPA